MTAPARILGIDFGTKRIGLALSDPLGFTAQGLETLAVQNKQKTLEHLVKLCSDLRVGEVVVGLPINMNGSMGPKAEEAKAWIEKLKVALSIPVSSWDERLTSREADRFMIEAGMSRAKQKKESDRMAATLILQNYLESKRSRNRS
jgi:putative holliday junction resolvase